MAVTVTQLREGLAANLAGLTGIQVQPYFLANPTPPAGHVFPGPIQYDLANARGLDKWTFTVQLFVALASDIGAQLRLDPFLAPSGSQSVKTLIEADQTLAGAFTLNPGESPVSVTACSGYLQFPKENQILLGADWTVEVLASGK